MRRHRAMGKRPLASLFVLLGLVVGLAPAPSYATTAAAHTSQRVLTAQHLQDRSQHLYLWPEFAYASDADAYANALLVFADSGLGIPLFRAEFHDSTEPCGGYRGRHKATGSGLSIVHVCVSYPRPALRERARERALMHEVAHAWMAQNVTPAQQNQFIERRGLEVWKDMSAAPWHRLGCEHAAEILLWGITSGERRMEFKIQNARWVNHDLDALFEILTADAAA